MMEQVTVVHHCRIRKVSCLSEGAHCIFQNLCGGNADTLGKVGQTVLREAGYLKLRLFMDIQQQGDSSTGLSGDNKGTVLYSVSGYILMSKNSMRTCPQILNVQKVIELHTQHQQFLNKQGS